jgi:hypothetical protein
MKRLVKFTQMMAAITFFACLFSFTNAVAQTVTVTSPNGGENWTAGTTNTITWTSDIVGNVRISLLKGGIQYSLISYSTPNDGTFDWLIPAGIASGTEYTVKISNCTNTAIISDVSDAAFAIVSGSGSSVTVVAPNGGETFTAGTTNTITWTSDITGNVRVTLLKGGVHYSLISAGTVNDGSFDWLIPAGLLAGTEYAVKVASSLNPLLFDVSDANFAIIAGGGTTVAVTSPNGGEALTAGTTNTVTWTSDITGNVRITLLKAGVHYTLISAGTPNDGSFDWLIPAALLSGTEYTVKVASSINPLLFDVSDANFTITSGSGTTVAVTSPNGGETLTAGTTNTIAWTSDVTGNVRISLLKGGLHYSLISAGTINDGSFDWLIPAGLLAGTEYTVKVASSLNPLLFDVSDANFSVVAGGGTSLLVTAPNGGEEFAAGTTSTITWTSDVTGYLRIMLVKGGVDFALISAKTTNDGNYDWAIPAGMISGTDFTVKISSCLNTAITDVSDANFTITGGSGSSVTVVAPNGGETFTAGTINTLTWTSDIVGNVRISLLKAGLHYALISSGTPNDGSFDWMIPSRMAAGTEYTVKISSSAYPLVFDVSDANFSIVAGSGSTLTLIAPNGGESLTAGSINTITWTSDIVGSVCLSLLKGGVRYSLIAGVLPNSGAFDWLIPAGIAAGEDYTVKISSCSNLLLTDVSDASFSIVPPTNVNSGITQNSELKSSITDQINASPVLSLYPNPAVDVLNVVSDREMNHVWMLNNLGQIVFEDASNSSQLQLNVREFNKGIYFVKIEAEGIFTTHKVVLK